MAIKLGLLSFLILAAGCGKEVNMTSVSKLEKFSSVTEGQVSKISQNGTLIRASKNGDFDYLKIDGGQYKISAYSSYETTKFISSIAPGSEVSVKFRGTIRTKEVVVEAIEKISN